METEIDYCVTPIDRKPLKVRILHAGTENIIHKDEVKELDRDMVKLWRLCGLADSDIKRIVQFLRS